MTFTLIAVPMVEASVFFEETNIYWEPATFIDRSLIYDGSYWWKFYFNGTAGSGIQYRYSTDLISWSSDYTLWSYTPTTNEQMPDVHIHGSTVYVVQTSGTSVYFRTGAISGTTITWGSVRTVFTCTTICYHATVDWNGTYYGVAASHVSAATYTVRQSFSTNGTFWSGPAAPMDFANYYRPQIVAMDAGRWMLTATFTGTPAYRYSIFTGTWSAPAAFDGGLTPFNYGAPLLADGTDPDLVYALSWEQSGTNNIWLTKYNSGWGTPESVANNTGNGIGPTISYDYSCNCVVVAWWSGDNLYIRVRQFDGTWGSITSIQNEPDHYVYTDGLQATIRNWDGMIAFSYVTGAGAPFNITIATTTQLGGGAGTHREPRDIYSFSAGVATTSQDNTIYANRYFYMRSYIYDSGNFTYFDNATVTLSPDSNNNVTLQWDNATDTYTKLYDVQNYAILNTGVTTKSTDYIWILNWYLKLNWTYPDGPMSVVNATLCTTTGCISNTASLISTFEADLAVDNGWVDYPTVNLNSPLVFSGYSYYYSTTTPPYNATGVIVYVSNSTDTLANTTSISTSTGLFHISGVTSPSTAGDYTYTLWSFTNMTSAQNYTITVHVVNATGGGGGGGGTGIYRVILMDEDTLLPFNTSVTSVTVTVYYSDSYVTFIDQNNFTVFGQPLLSAEVAGTYIRSFLPKSTDTVSYFYLVSSGTVDSFSFTLIDYSGLFPVNSIIRVNLTGTEISSGYFGFNNVFSTALKPNKYYSVTIYDSDPATRIYGVGSVYADSSDTSIDIVITGGSIVSPTLNSQNYAFSILYTNNTNIAFAFSSTNSSTSTGVRLRVYVKNDTITKTLIYDNTWAGPITSVNQNLAGNGNLSTVALLEFVNSVVGSIAEARPVAAGGGAGNPMNIAISSTVFGLSGFIDNENAWSWLIGLVIIILLGLLFSQYDANIGAIVVPIAAAMLWLAGYLPNGPAYGVPVAITIAGFIGVLNYMLHKDANPSGGG